MDIGKLWQAFERAAASEDRQAQLARLFLGLKEIPEPLRDYHIRKMDRLRQSIVLAGQPVLLAGIVNDIALSRKQGSFDREEGRAFARRLGRLISDAYDIPEPAVSDRSPENASCDAVFQGNRGDLRGTLFYSDSILKKRWAQIATVAGHEIAGHGAEHVLTLRVGPNWHGLPEDQKVRYPAISVTDDFGRACAILATNNPYAHAKAVYFDSGGEGPLYRAQPSERIAFWLEEDMINPSLIRPLTCLYRACHNHALPPREENGPLYFSAAGKVRPFLGRSGGDGNGPACS